MVEGYTTEEEQIEALKRWWKDNGKSIIAGVVLSVIAVFGWRAWQSHQYATGEQTSVLYEELADAMQASKGSEDAEMSATITHLAGRLKTEFDSSVYARYAALLLAKQSVENNDLDGALRELQWVLDRADPEGSLYPLAQFRMARVLLAKGGDDNAHKALALLGTGVTEGYKASREEVRGDLYQSLGQLDKARVAYRNALAEVERMGTDKPILKIKLDDLAEDEV